MKKTMFLVARALACAALTGCLNIAPLMGGNRGKVAMEIIQPSEKWYTTDQVLLIPLSGLVTTGDATSYRKEPGMLVGLKDRLLAAEDNRRIKAVILRIDTPGGEVTAADLIVRELKEFKKKKNVPIIALMTDLAASGGFYIAMAADEIYALPTTVTGSIGVVTMLPGIKGLSDKIGFEMRVIKSGRNKDIGSPWKSLTPEQQRIFQNLIDEYYQRFCQVILDSRAKKGLTPEKLKPLADGRIFDAPTALAAGLIDGVKYPDEVIRRAEEAARIGDAEVVSYEYPNHYRGHFYAGDEAPQPLDVRHGDVDLNLLKVDLGGLGAPSMRARFLYLWLP